MMDFLFLVEWGVSMPLAMDTIHTGLIIVLLILACAMTIYNLPWSDTELTATHHQTRTQFLRLKMMFRDYFSESPQQVTATGRSIQHQSSSVRRMDGVLLDGVVIEHTRGHKKTLI